MINVDIQIDNFVNCKAFKTTGEAVAYLQDEAEGMILDRESGEAMVYTVVVSES